MEGSKDDLFSEKRWMEELVKDVDSDNPHVRLKALELLGRYMGLLTAKGAKAGSRKTVEFDD